MSGLHDQKATKLLKECPDGAPTMCGQGCSWYTRADAISMFPRCTNYRALYACGGDDLPTVETLEDPLVEIADRLASNGSVSRRLERTAVSAGF